MTTFVRVARLAELPEGEPVRCEARGEPVGLLRRGGEVLAFADRCTHEEASLCEGFVEGFTIECPLHGASFDLRTGKALSLPATRDLRTYPVRLEGGEVSVGLTEGE